MKRKPVNKFIIIVIIALFAPIFTYTIYQVSKRDENEQLIRSIYNRQLESILFSSIYQIRVNLLSRSIYTFISAKTRAWTAKKRQIFNPKTAHAIR